MQFNFAKIQGESSEGEYLLLNLKEWISIKDGDQYKAIWGKCRLIMMDGFLGFEPENSANWLIQIGDGESPIFVTASQVTCLQVCKEEPTVNSIYKVS